ncbi:DUF817 domain-containing protein [Parvularcula sp. IMCC14364]|uniref:DUF817 domain-containing protein n=1 Tax=Parvularcula sp. IMCC14364 TaxID=3067902 RepID=UPI003555E8E7
MPQLEQWLGRSLPGWLVKASTEFLVFGVKQAWACLFGGLLLFAIVATGFWYPADWALARYDFLFLYAVGIQVTFLVTRLERPPEALVILIFHVVGTVMELFKTSVGSWVYPEANFFRLEFAGGMVPLFSGFMYAAVGSYLARVSRTHDFQFTHYPPLWQTGLLALMVYVNFFSHHFLPDIRLALFGFAGLLYWRTWVYFRVWRWQHRMPLLLGFLLVALFIWLAENIGTFAGAWLYPDQQSGWRIVSLAKMGSWYLLMIISWVLVTLVHRPKKT